VNAVAQLQLPSCDQLQHLDLSGGQALECGGRPGRRVQVRELGDQPAGDGRRDEATPCGDLSLIGTKADVTWRFSRSSLGLTKFRWLVGDLIHAHAAVVPTPVGVTHDDR
jgi:hypothetical protein